MKCWKGLLFFLILAICTGVLGRSADSDDLVIICKLKRITRNVPDCGIIHFGSLAEYRDLRILRGRYSESRIYVVHDCIELPRESYTEKGIYFKKFTEGDYHKMLLSKKNTIRVESVENGEIVPNLPLYYCRRVGVVSSTSIK